MQAACGDNSEGRSTPERHTLASRCFLGALALLVVACGGASNGAVDDTPTGPPADVPDLEVVRAEMRMSESQLDSVFIGHSSGLAIASVRILQAPMRMTATIVGDWLRLAPPPEWAGLDTVVVRVKYQPAVDGAKIAASIISQPIAVEPGPYRVSYNPYASVHWATTGRWRVQLHDHPGNVAASYRSYDSAGYHIASLQDYSGAPTLSTAWTSRHWPAESWLPAATLNGFRNIRFLLPSAEEAAALHLTSPFLTEYIAGQPAARRGAPLADNEYVTTQQGIDQIRTRGGLPFLAHPWTDASDFTSLRSYTGIEVYSAFAEARREQGKESFFTDTDRNVTMVSLWDRLLQTNPRVVGIAVNDHFGPDSKESGLSMRVRNSGWIFALADELTPASLRTAIEGGAVFAVRDLSVPKGGYPVVDSVWADASAVHVASNGTVRWVAAGKVVGAGRDFPLTALPVGSHYVRAEIAVPDGSTIYTQAFEVRLLRADIVTSMSPRLGPP